MTVAHKNLYRLEDLSDYQVAENYSDVRGWAVKDADNRTIGKVDHLLASRSAERVVYLDVEVDEALIEEGFNTYQNSVREGVHEFLNKEGENHLIIPIGMAEIEVENKLVKTSKIDSSTFAKIKRFRKIDDVDFEYELNLMRFYMGDGNIHSSETDGEYYDRKEFSNSFYNRDLD
jgi:hypothetical protein